MKKMISISVIALFAMIPTFGWAAFDGVASGSTDERVTETVPTNTSTTTYVTTRSSEADNDLTAAHGFQRAGAGVESIVTSQDPKYNVTQITERDGTDVAALSFVKGAYNDAITKINKIYEIKEQTAGKFKLNTTWDAGTSGVHKVPLMTVNQEFEDEEDDVVVIDDNGDNNNDGVCPDGFEVVSYSSSGIDGYFMAVCISKTREHCSQHDTYSGYEKRYKAWKYDGPEKGWYKLCIYEGQEAGLLLPSGADW